MSKMIAYVSSVELNRIAGADKFSGVVEVEIIYAVVGKNEPETGNCVVTDPLGSDYGVSWTKLFHDKDMTQRVSRGDFYVSHFGTLDVYDQVCVYNKTLLRGPMTVVEWAPEGNTTYRSILDFGGVRVAYQDVNIYDNVDDALKLETVEIHHLDGTTEIKGGEYNLFRLTEEQERAIQDLESALKTCKDMGILLGFDTCDDCVRAINNASGMATTGEQQSCRLPEECVRTLDDKVLCHIYADEWFFQMRCDD